MTAWYGSEIGTGGTLRQKVTALRRPLLVGALAAGLIAIGASTAPAASPLGSPSPVPSTALEQGMSTSMMSGTTMGIMLGTTAGMMGSTSSGGAADMMGITGTGAMGR